MIPAMLGTVMAFLMIDERDGKVAELMAITPAGYNGYVFNRFFMPCVLTVLYTIIGYFILDGGIKTGFLEAVYLAFLGGVEAVIIGLMLFRFADDKVKGIAYSKGLTLFELAAFADLFGMPWLSIVCSLFPFYWIARLINDGFGIVNVILAGTVHALWVFIVYSIRNR
jgi:fluoroquinolone transport system permease protein